MDLSTASSSSVTAMNSSGANSNNWNSWSALKGRRRNPVRLSASVDSIPYAENDFFSSVGSLSNCPDGFEDDGSVNNILDALGDRTSSSSAAGLSHLSGAASWSVLDGGGTSAIGVPPPMGLDGLPPPPHHLSHQLNHNLIHNPQQSHFHHRQSSAISAMSGVSAQSGRSSARSAQSTGGNVMLIAHSMANSVGSMTSMGLRPPTRASINSQQQQQHPLAELSLLAGKSGGGETIDSASSSGVGSGQGTLSSSSPTGSNAEERRTHRRSNSAAGGGGGGGVGGGGATAEEYEHVYCQLDPYFNPPLNSLTKSQPLVGLSNNHRINNQQNHQNDSSTTSTFSSRASIRSWGRSVTMDRDPGIVPFLQQALAQRYREMLNTYQQQAPSWFQERMGPMELEDVCPLVYQVLMDKNSIYGTTTSTTKNSHTAANKFSSTSSANGTSERQSQQTQDSFKPILPHQIFAKTTEDDMSRAFWLEGEPGSGKTLLCCRLLSEWVAYHSYSYTNSALNSRIGEFQVVFYVPLREVRGSLNRFLMRELIPKKSILSRMKPGNVWKCLNLLGNSMLLILDGLDDVVDSDVLKEIQDILNGQMFPQSMVLVTSRPSQHGEKLNNWMNRNPVRKYCVSGMDWTQIQCCIRRYFTGKKFRNESRMAEILSDRHDLCALASNPFMCLLLCSVFEQVGDVPCSNAELYLYLLRSLIQLNGLIKADASSSPSSKDLSIPPKFKKVLQDFGKLTLHKLSENRVEYTEGELEDFCENGASDLVKCGVLLRSRAYFSRSKNNKKGLGHPLTLMHPSLNTFLASYYLSTTTSHPNLLRREMDLLPGIEVLQESQVRPGASLAFTVITLAMELLGKNASSVFSVLSLLDISLNYLMALLRAAGFYESNLRACASIIKSQKHVSINVASEWVSEFKQVISSEFCPFESLEIVIKPGYSLARLIEGLCLNESIASVKFTSVPGQDWSGVEVNLICGQLLQLLSEKRLKCLEISMTCLEDKEHNRFQAMVDSLCYIISKGVPLQKLVLDMDLTSPQVVQLASFIKCHDYIDVLHLPHLGCGPEGLQAIADLLYSKPFMSLNLAGLWRSTNPDDSSSDIVIEPIPMTGTGPLFHIGGGGSRDGTLSSVHKMGGAFSSLPRGPTSGSIKSPSIRRKRLNNNNNNNHHLTEGDKHNSDSTLFQRNFLPVPTCDVLNHEQDGFHGIFSVLRLSPAVAPTCNLKSLNLSKCVLGWEDVICLGETIRKSTCLDSLRMEGMKLCDVLPVLLGLQENTCLKMLDLSSPHVVIGDDALQLACQSLAKNQTLRLLSIQGWTFYIEDTKSMEALESLLTSTRLQDLDLTSVRVHLSSGNGGKNSLHKTPNTAGGGAAAAATLDKKSSTKELKHKEKLLLKTSSSFGSSMTLNGKQGGSLLRDLSFLRLGGMQVEQGKSQVWKSPEILQHLLPLIDRTKITHLDLSLDKNDTTPVIDDKVGLRTIKIIGQNLPRLQRLNLNHWKLRLSEKIAKEFAKPLALLANLSSVSLDSSVVYLDTGDNASSNVGNNNGGSRPIGTGRRGPGSAGTGVGTFARGGAADAKRIDHLVAASVLGSVKALSDLSWANFDPIQMPMLAKALGDHQPRAASAPQALTLKLEGVPLPSIKILISNSAARATGVAVEYCGGNCVVVRRSKEKNEFFMGKLKRLL